MQGVHFRAANIDTYKAAATRLGVRLSDWLRDAADSAAKAQGFSTGSPEQQYALVTPAGEIITTSFSLGADPRGEWLPIENRDSAQFDPAQHWRLKPLPLRLEDGTIIREFPVVAKSQERA